MRELRSEYVRTDRRLCLAQVRESIDRIDDELTELMGRRLQLARRASEAKIDLGLQQRDLGREAEVVRRAATRASAMGLDPEPVRAIFWNLIELSHRAVLGGATRR